MGESDDEAPWCPRCGVQVLEPAGQRNKPYWWCPDCGPVRLTAADSADPS